MVVCPCPDRSRLADYLIGNVSVDELESIADHLETCKACGSSVEELEPLADPLMLELRQADVPDEFRDEPQLNDVLTRLRTLAVGAPSESTTSIHRLPPGTRIGVYRIDAVLGDGGMGVVYRAWHTQLDRAVALKLLPKDRLGRPEAVARFRQEMKAVGRLDHPNLVKAHDAGEENGVPFLAMEFLDGLDASRVVHRLGPLPSADACELVRQAAEGLEYASRQGIVHRDVKPSNLMLTSSGVVKVLDLGLARVVHPTAKEEISQAGEILGTLEYMAPERLRDGRQADSQGDVYSLGCTLYKLLTGRTPFSDSKYDTPASRILAIIQDPLPPPETFRPDLPQGLAELIGRMLAKDRATRPATPGEVAIAVRPFTVGADLARVYERARTVPPPLDSAAAPQSAEPAADVVPKAGLHPTARRSHHPAILGRWGILLAVTGTLAAAILAVVVSLHTRQGTLVLTVDQPGAQIRIDDRQVEVQWEADGMKVEIPAGAHTLQVAKDGFVPFREPFEIRRGGRVVLSVTLVPQAGASGERCLQRHTGAVMGVAFSPDGRQTLTGGKDGMVYLWDVETGSFVRSFRGHTDAVRTVAFSPDATMVVTGGEDGTLRLWDAVEAREIRRLEGHQDKVSCAVFSPDGTQVLSGSFDTSVRLWEVASGRSIHTLTGNRSWVRSVAISPDGRWGLSGGNDAWVRVWDLKEGRLEHVLQGHRTVVGTVGFGPDSRLAISAGWDQTIRLWDIARERQIRVLDGGQGGNRHVALIPHSGWAIAGGSASRLHIWDLQTGRRLQRLEGHTSGVCVLAVSAHGRYAISGSEDHTARLWPLPKPTAPVELRLENLKPMVDAQTDEGTPASEEAK